MRLELVEGLDRIVRDFVSSRAPMGHAVFTDHDKGFAIVRADRKMVAGIVLSNWQPGFQSLELSVVAVNSCFVSPQIVTAIGEFVFGKLSVNRLTARTSSKNHRALKALKNLGFVPEGTSAHYYGVGKNAENFRMLKHEWVAKYGPLHREAA